MAIENYPHLSALDVFFFWQVIGFECSMEHQWGEPKDNICLSRHVPAIDGDILFLVPSKKSPPKFAESTHKRQPHVWKRTESDKFVCACVSGKKSFKAGHRDEKRRRKIFILSALVSTSSSPFSSPFSLLLFWELENVGSGHGTREDWGRAREEKLSVDEEEEKARDEEGAGDSFWSLPPNKSVSARQKESMRERAREGHRQGESERRICPQRSSPGGLKCRSISPPPPPSPWCSPLRILPAFIYLLFWTLCVCFWGFSVIWQKLVVSAWLTERKILAWSHGAGPVCEEVSCSARASVGFLRVCSTLG